MDMENAASNNTSTSPDSRSRQRKNNNVKDLKVELKAAFEAAKSPDEMLKALGKLKQSAFYDEYYECLKVAQKLAQKIRQHHNILGYDSRGRKLKGKSAKLKQAFYRAKSADEMLKAFRKMESHFRDKELGYDCWKLAQQLYEERQDTQNILCYGKRALKFAIDCDNTPSTHGSSLMVPSTLNALGYACCKLNRYNESLSYLNWSERNLSLLELVKSCPAEFVLLCLHFTHFELAIVKTAMRRGDEVVIHMRKILEIREKRNMKGSIDQAIEEVVDGLKGLGLNEQDRVDGAVRLLNEMKESAGGEESSKKNSKCGVQDGRVV